jgi:2-polyprenyl-3-methyl-5-hydroxy-6-metoxy-1,4-benzoquinol methylase
MGDRNQLLYLQRFAPVTEGAVLEIGSKDYGSTVPFRKHIAHSEYVGLDMEAGPGVDVVGDLAEGLCGLPEAHFSLVICCSVLEHVSRPWKMAEHIVRLTRAGGLVYLSVPWVWRYHPYPDDYFRFSWRGVEALFPDCDWAHRYYSTTVIGEFFEITEATTNIDDRMALYKELGEERRRKYLPYLMVNMLGAKVAQPVSA